MPPNFHLPAAACCFCCCHSVGAGLLLGGLLLLLVRPPPGLRRHVVVATALGNAGNLPLVLVAALVRETGGKLFGQEVSQQRQSAQQQQLIDCWQSGRAAAVPNS